MFVGHMAAGLLLKARVPEAPLRGLLFATVVSDFLCGLLMVVGLETTTVHGSFVFSHLDIDIGYSHSLLGSLAYATLAYFIGTRITHNKRAGIALGLALFSHFVLDALSHLSDMPLIGFGAKHDLRIGTHLAAYPIAFFAVELAFCLFAWFMYDPGNLRLLGVILALMLIWSNSVFGYLPMPALSSQLMGAATFMSFVGALAAFGWALRRRRRVL